jgi:Kef-type K+ transport system membrane component KefB
VDDILSILALSVFLAVVTGSSSLAGLLWLVVRMILFLVGAAAFGLWVLPHLSRAVPRLPISQGTLAFAIVILLGYGLAAELVGQMAAIIGTFLAGLMFARTPEKNVIEQGMSSLAYGLFVPIFFVNIGLTVDINSLPFSAVWLILAVTAAAVLGKLLGAAGGARLGGLPGRESIQLGAGMVARGEVTLIIVAIGSKAGLIDNNVFSAAVAAMLLCSLATPLLMRAAFHKPRLKVPVSPAKEENKK